MNSDRIKLASADVCTGCSACAASCVSGALKMVPDEFGFLVPEINDDSCTECGKCMNSCPVTAPVDLYPEAVSYAAQADMQLRMESSSGGVFSVLAGHILKENGVVFGAVLRDDMQVEHICIERAEQLPLLRGSKYIQSVIGDAYAEAKAMLDSGKKVLFSGCPCQIAGLRSYLHREYDDLYTLDLLCHGVASYQFFKEYLNENFHDAVSVSFRDKKHGGWKCDNLSVTSREGEIAVLSAETSPFEKGYHSNIILRQSCYSCVYNSPERAGDITLGDFWGIERYKPELNDNIGTSFVQPNTPKGRGLLEKIRGELKVLEEAPKSVSKENRYNRTTTSKPVGHERFLELYRKYGFTKAAEYAGGKKYDVGIVGCWSVENHGSNLCYYALYQTLCDMGLEPLMIERPADSPWKPNNSPICFAESPYPEWALAPIYPSKSEMNKLNEQCDTFILGSDQLFYHDLYSSLGEVSDLSFIDGSRRMIAYGASVGRPVFEGSPDEIAKLSYFLSRFDSFSVREQDAVPLFADTFGIKSDFVLDPVFLCDKKHYISMAERGTEIGDKPYIAAYILDPSPKKEQILLSIAEEMNKPLHIFSDVVYSKDNISGAWSLNTTTLTSNEDWLRAIIDSDFVVTDSFHGTCFAILFNKPFVCIANPRRGISRFNSLLQLLGIQNRMVNDLTDDVLDLCLEPVDYKKVSDILGAEIERSLEWLKTSLSRPLNKAMSGYDVLNKRLSGDEVIQKEAYKRGLSTESWLSNTHERVNDLEQSLQQETARSVSTESWLSNTHERVNALEQSLQQESARSVSTESWLSSTHERVNALEQTLQQETARSVSTESWLSNTHERVTALEQSLQQETTRSASIEKRLSDINERVDSAESVIQAHSDKIKELEEKLSETRQELSESAVRIYKQGKTIAELKYRVDELEKQTLWTLIKNTFRLMFTKK